MIILNYGGDEAGVINRRGIQTLCHGAIADRPALLEAVEVEICPGQVDVAVGEFGVEPHDLLEPLQSLFVLADALILQGQVIGRGGVFRIRSFIELEGLDGLVGITRALSIVMTGDIETLPLADSVQERESFAKVLSPALQLAQVQK